jgi:endonuclease III
MLAPINFSQKSRRSQAQIVRRVCECLEEAYGRPRLGNPHRPLDDLFFILISNRTAPGKTLATYRSLTKRFPRWDMLSEVPVEDIERVLRPAGLSLKKARQIRGIAEKLRHDFGRATLHPLATWSDAEVRTYLHGLPGVSTKVAYCVMMYALGREVLPVDVHVHRVCLRLGWLGSERPQKVHAVLEQLVPPHRRYAFHVDLVMLGRMVCRPREPKHESCPVKSWCDLCYASGNRV